MMVLYILFIFSGILSLGACMLVLLLLNVGFTEGEWSIFCVVTWILMVQFLVNLTSKTKSNRKTQTQKNN